MERIEGEVRRELARFGPAAGMAEVVAIWPEAVGSAIAASAWPARIARDGTLQIYTADSIWAFELSQQAPRILEHLHELLGESVPKSLKFIPGRLPEPATGDTAASPAVVLEPGPEALQRADRLVAGIENEELRVRVGRAVALSLARPHSDQPFW